MTTYQVTVNIKVNGERNPYTATSNTSFDRCWDLIDKKRKAISQPTDHVVTDVVHTSQQDYKY